MVFVCLVILGGSQYEVKFKIKDKIVTGTYTSQQNDGVWSYDVMLSNPIPLQPNEEFTIIATIKGPQFLQRSEWKTISESR